MSEQSSIHNACRGRSGTGEVALQELLRRLPALGADVTGGEVPAAGTVRRPYRPAISRLSHMSAQENKDRLISAFRASRHGNPAALADILHPEVQVHEPAYLHYGGTHHGRDGFQKLRVEAAKVLDLATLKILTSTADEDRVVLLMSADLVADGSEMFVTEHWRMRDGLVDDIRVFWFGLPDPI